MKKKLIALFLVTAIIALAFYVNRDQGPVPKTVTENSQSEKTTVSKETAPMDAKVSITVPIDPKFKP